MQFVNEAPGKVTGTDIVPVSLELSKSAFNEADPEKTNLKLLLKNTAGDQPVSGVIQLLQPEGYAGKLTPIRFRGIGLGQSVTIELPYLASDTLQYRVTLDGGVTYTASVKLGQSFASRFGAKPSDAPAIDLSRADQYFSLGGKWKGADDLSSSSNVSWDDKNLYVSVVVHDDVHHQTWSNGDIWQGDSIQLGIDWSRKDGSSSRNVSELGFGLNGQGGVTQWRWRAPDGLATGALTGAKANITRDETKGQTVYDLTIPIDQLHGPGYAKAPGDPIGFTLLMNENDGAGRSGFMEYNGGIGTGKDAALFGDMYLLKGSFTELLEESAETAVESVKKQSDMTRVDAAANFVQLLPEGKAKQKLLKELEKIRKKAL
ncbi:sugar-binding protein [Cohnella silvisoli]|uniref:Sugar-binding protein n=2 Tax=Cohnella silvisoli TaxID=2873699 RepID=A0ABV1KPZ9_9BACL